MEDEEVDLTSFAKEQAPVVGRVCRACALPPATRAQVDEAVRTKSMPRRVIAAWLASEGHATVTVNVLNLHAERGHAG